jgi:hypothetical protein
MGAGHRPHHSEFVFLINSKLPPKLSFGILLTIMSEPIGYHDFADPANIKFNKKTLKFKDPELRKAYEPKNKKETDDNPDKKKQEPPKGSFITPLYTADQVKNDVVTSVTGLPRISIKTAPMRVKLVVDAERKHRIAVMLMKNNADHQKLVAMFTAFEDTFRAAAVASNGKLVEYKNKKVPFTESVFDTLYQPIIRENEDPNAGYDTFSIAVPIYDDGVGTKFYNKNGRKESEILIDQFNTVKSLLSANTLIKFAFTIKEIWLASDKYGTSIVANSIVIVKQAPKKVIRPKNFSKVAKSVFMEFYSRKNTGPNAVPGSVSIGGGFYHTFNQTMIIDGKKVINDDENDVPNTFYWATPPFLQKWSCKGKFINAGQTEPPLQLTMELTPNVNDACVNADLVRDGINKIDEAYVEYMVKNRETLLTTFDPIDQAKIDEEFLRNGHKKMISLGKADSGAIQRQNIYMKFQKSAGKYETRIYDLRENIEELAAEADEETRLKIQNLDPEFLDRFVPYELAKIETDPIDYTLANIDDVIEPGSWVIAINKTERWGSWMPPDQRKNDGTGGPHGHGLSTSTALILILRKDELNYGVRTTGFEDDIDDTTTVDKGFTFGKSKNTISESSKGKKAKVADETSSTSRHNSEEPIVSKSKKQAPPPEDDDEEPTPPPKAKSKKQAPPPEDDDEEPTPPPKAKAKKQAPPPEDEDEEPTPPPNAKAKKQAPPPEDDDEEPVPPPKAKSKKQAPPPEDDDDDEPAPPPKAKAKKPAKVPTVSDDE